MASGAQWGSQPVVYHRQSVVYLGQSEVYHGYPLGVSAGQMVQLSDSSYSKTRARTGLQQFCRYKDSFCRAWSVGFRVSLFHVGVGGYILQLRHCRLRITGSFTKRTTREVNEKYHGNCIGIVPYSLVLYGTRTGIYIYMDVDLLSLIPRHS